MNGEDLQLRASIAAVAADMVAGRIDLRSWCSRIVGLRPRLAKADLADPDLRVIVAVDSELDDVPMGPARARWSPEALAEKDEQAAAYLAESEAGILRACRSVAQKWR